MVLLEALGKVCDRDDETSETTLSHRSNSAKRFMHAMGRNPQAEAAAVVLVLAAEEQLLALLKEALNQLNNPRIDEDLACIFQLVTFFAKIGLVIGALKFDRQHRGDEIDLVSPDLSAPTTWLPARSVVERDRPSPLLESRIVLEAIVARELGVSDDEVHRMGRFSSHLLMSAKASFRFDVTFTASPVSSIDSRLPPSPETGDACTAGNPKRDQINPVKITDAFMRRHPLPETPVGPLPLPKPKSTPYARLELINAQHLSASTGARQSRARNGRPSPSSHHQIHALSFSIGTLFPTQVRIIKGHPQARLCPSEARPNNSAPSFNDIRLILNTAQVMAMIRPKSYRQLKIKLNPGLVLAVEVERVGVVRGRVALDEREMGRCLPCRYDLFSRNEPVETRWRRRGAPSELCRIMLSLVPGSSQFFDHM
ncbi:hypothetical protein CLAIMM_12076 [Cladophialophora immunda]|nr:hypothetical protein CLAIMM_12076 [Cladophialophora immunda]